ncbi:hypothetical protein D3C80_1995560 [compost metagenome]
MLGKPCFFRFVKLKSADFQQDIQGSGPADALKALIVLLGEYKSEFFGELSPGDKMISGGVDEHAVQIEQTSFNC